MKSNERFLQEAFFKKTTYLDKLNKKLPSYTPYGDEKAPSTASFAISDASELKRRLTSGLGVSFANNSIKAMSNKAIKTFPIIVSDTLEPETVVMLKRYLEEQYADYINLMISNKVIDIADFKTGQDTGNIAILAIDSLSGPDFSSDRIARKARDTGSVGVSDFLANVPIYNLLRQESCSITCGNDVIDTLLEGAMIVPSENADDLVRFLVENDPREGYERPTPRETDYVPTRDKYSRSYNTGAYKRFRYVDQEQQDGKTARLRELSLRISADAGDEYNSGEKLSGMTSARSLILGKSAAKASQLDKIMDRTTADIIYSPGNEHIRDRFEKAGILLVSRRISGNEYCNYLKVRLGIPVPPDVSANLRAVYKATDVQHHDGENITIAQARAISKSLDTTDPNYFKAVNKIGRSTLSYVAAGAGIGATVGAGAGVGIAAAVAAAPLWAPILAGALTGTALGVTIAAIIKSRRKKFEAQVSTEGWERVERMIDNLDKNWRDLKTKLNDNNSNRQIDTSSKNSEDSEQVTMSRLEFNELQHKISTFEKKVEQAMKSGAPLTESDYSVIDGAFLTEAEWNETIDMISEELHNDPELNLLIEAELLDESLLSEKRVTIDDYLGKVKANQIVYDPSEMMVTPAYSARSQYAYGSAEYDRREAKDRKYNAPLIMTIRFRERLDNDKFSDNEMTAVIGILGVVVRVPSDEMKFILKSNAEGNTLKGFLGSSTIGNSIADLLSTTKLKSDVEKLPISSDVWHNLEKIGHLALANKLGGKQAHNISNAHIIFSQKEIDDLRNETGIDYIKDKKLAEQLLKRYSAFSIMIANDPSERVYVFDDPDNISWNVIPYSAIRNRDSSDQLTSALIRASQGRL